MSNVPTTTSRCPVCGSLLVGSGPCLRCLAKVSLEMEMEEARDMAEGFQVMELIGRGGAGKVYRAVQRSTGEVVALKVLGEGILASEEARHRFQQESGLARRLDHPHIVKILAVSPVDEPEPWVALEYVEGRSLSDVLRRGLPSPQVVAEWVRQISGAVEHAHEHGVLHRDLKPSNVLIDNDGKARLTDFGVARLIETSQAEMTRTGQVLGTPAYMAPEQATGKRGDVGPAADVYGLGAVLYHGLTGRAPFMADSVAAILHQVVHADPVPLRRLNASLPRDLETICLRCLEKEPVRRPRSALTLAAELDRFLAGRPILSQPPTLAERTARWARRHVRESALIAALSLSLILGAVALVFQWRATVDARKSAEIQALHAERDNYATSMREAAAAIHAGRLTEADELLDQWIPGPERQDFRGMEWFFLHQAATTPALATFSPRHDAAVTGIAFLPDGDRFVTVSQGSEPRVWSLKERRLLQTLSDTGRGHDAVIVSPDGRWLLLADPSTAKILKLDAATFQKAGEFPGRDMALSPDGRFLVTTLANPWTLQFGGRVQVFDFASGNPVAILSENARRATFQPGGSLLAVAEATHGVHLYNTRDWKRTGPDLETTRHVHDLSFSLQGDCLFGCDWSGTVWSWEVATGLRHVLQARPFRTSKALPGRRGRSVFLASTDRLIHVVDALTGQETGHLGGHADEVWSLAFTPDGKQLLSGGKDGRLMLWDAEDPVEDVPSLVTPRESGQPLFFPSGHKVLLRFYSLPDQVVNLDTLQRQDMQDDGYTSAVSPDGQLVQLHPELQVLTYHSASDGLESKRVDFSGQLGAPIIDYGVSENGRWMALFLARDKGCGLAMIDLPTGTITSRREMAGHGMRCQAISNDGRWVVNGAGPLLSLYDTSRADQPPAEFRAPFYEFGGLAFSPDSTRLAAGNHDAAVRVFRVAGLKLEYEFRGHYFDTPGVAFSPDGRTLVSLGSREGLRFWRLDCGREAGFLSEPESQHYLSLAPDGSSILIEKPEGFDILRVKK